MRNMHKRLTDTIFSSGIGVHFSHCHGHVASVAKSTGANSLCVHASHDLLGCAVMEVLLAALQDSNHRTLGDCSHHY